MNKKHIVSTVFNSVEGDSRVIKTAQASLGAGYEATIVGVCNGAEVIRKEVEGVSVVLVPNFSQQLKRHKLWGGVNRDLRLLIGGQVRSTIPEIIALKPDLIHSHDMIGLKIGAAASKTLLSGGRVVPWVHDIHEFVAGLKGELAEIYMPICLAWEREYLRTADQLLTVSDTLAQEVENRYFLPSKPTVVYNTPNYESFSNDLHDIRSHIGLSSDVPLVVFVGGATPLRGCDTILKALSYLEGVHLAFVSQGKYVEELSEKALAMNMGERFHVHPYVPSDQVTSFIRTADIGIHGLVHYPNAEVAMPNKMFEYLHAGIPMVVSDVASMKEFVEKYHIGSSFVADDASSCAETIRRVLSMRDELANNITPELKKMFSWEEQTKKIQSVYRNLLTEERARPDRDDIDSALMWEKLDTLLFETTYSQSLSISNMDRMNQLESVIIKKQNETQKKVSQIGSVLTKKLDETKKTIFQLEYTIIKKLEFAITKKKRTFMDKCRGVIITGRNEGVGAAFRVLGRKAKKLVGLR